MVIWKKNESRKFIFVFFRTGTGEEANDAYLSVAPQYQMTKQEKSYNVKVSVYRWQGAYYDLAYFLYAQNPQAIRHAQILSTGFLAIANYRDDTGSSSIHSEVFRYSHKDSKYVSFQKIRTKGAKSVEFCSVATGEHEDHFLAIANHCQLGPLLKFKSHFIINRLRFKGSLSDFGLKQIREVDATTT